MALTFTPTKKDAAKRGFVLIGTIVFSGSYPGSGGDVLDFGPYNPFLSNVQPNFVEIVGKAGFSYLYDFAQKKVTVRVNDAGGANAPMGEHTTAAYAAGVSGDTVLARVEWAA